MWKYAVFEIFEEPYYSKAIGDAQRMIEKFQTKC